MEKNDLDLLYLASDILQRSVKNLLSHTSVNKTFFELGLLIQHIEHQIDDLEESCEQKEPPCCPGCDREF